MFNNGSHIKAILSRALELPRRVLGRRRTIHPWMARIFEPTDFSPVPPDWRSEGPNFVGIGSTKAGTTWWYNLLLKHPQVRANRLKRKELHYFEHFGYAEIGDQEIQTYREAFAAPDGAICGEWSPNYLAHPFTMQHIKTAAGNAKLLVIVRNPIDRAVSHLNQLLSARSRFFNLQGTPQKVLKVFSLFPEAFCPAPYAEPLRRVLRIFPKSQLQVLQYEKCKMAPAQELASTFRFLEIDDSFVPQGLSRYVNKKRYVVGTPDEGERRRIAECFLPDVAALKNLCPELDLSLWPEFERGVGGG